MARLGKVIISCVLLLGIGCASIADHEPNAGAAPAAISAAPGSEFTWRSRTYSVDQLGDVIRAAKHSEGITSVVLLYDQDTTVQDIIDVATISRAASIPAFYQQDGKLRSIEVSH